MMGSGTQLSAHAGTRRPSRRGMTLIELVVYCALIGYLTYAVYEIFIGTQRYFAQSDASVMVQQSAYATLKRLTLEMSETSSSYVFTAIPPDAGVIFASPRRDGSGSYSYDATSGRLNFQQWVCYYLDTTTDPAKPVFNRRTINITPPDDTPTIDPAYDTPAEFAAYIGAGAQPARRVGGDAYLLDVQASTIIRCQYALTVECRRTVYDKLYSFKVQNVVSSHNN